MFIHRDPPKHYLDYAHKDKNPVILIPGISSRWGVLKKLADNISLKGHPVYVVRKLDYNFFDIPTSAKFVRGIIDENNLKNAVIVRHSKGGLIRKYYLAHENKDGKIKGLVAIATPFSGSKIVYHLNGKYFKELSPESKMVQDLNKNKEINSKIVSIMPVFDNHVWHEKGSFIEGAKNITVTTKGHHKILFDKNVIDKIIELIEEFN